MLDKQYMITPNDNGIMAHSDARSIQNAVDMAQARGINEIVIPRRNERTGEELWQIDEAVLLPDDMTVWLDNCHLRLADGAFCNIFRNRNAYTALGKTLDGEQKNIRIIGLGGAVLDGGKPNGLTEKTSLKDGYPSIRENNFILFSNVRDFVIKDVKMIHQRWWAVNLYYCRHGLLSNLDIYADDSIKNQDGLDLRCGCNNIVIENITGQAGDDLVALTGIKAKSEHLFYVEGKDWDIHSVIIRNVKGTSCSKAVVALRNQDGVKLHDVIIDGILDTSEAVGCKPYATLRIGQNAYIHDRSSRLGETYNIHASNIHCGCDTAVMLCATVYNSSFRNITVGGTAPCAFSVNEGANVENVLVDGIFYNVDHCTSYAVSSKNGDLYRNDCGPKFAVIHFNNYGNPILEGRDRSRNVRIRNVFVNKLAGRPLVHAIGDVDVEVCGVHITDRREEETVVLEDNARVRLQS